MTFASAFEIFSLFCGELVTSVGISLLSGGFANKTAPLKGSFHRHVQRRSGCRKAAPSAVPRRVDIFIVKSHE